MYLVSLQYFFLVGIISSVCSMSIMMDHIQTLKYLFLHSIMNYYGNVHLEYYYSALNMVPTQFFFFLVLVHCSFFFILVGGFYSWYLKVYIFLSIKICVFL